MGRITVNRTMAQFSSKLSCTPELWNPRESRLNGKSKEAVEINAKIDKLLLAINSAFDSLLERKQEFDATVVKNAFQGCKDTQMTLLKLFDRHIAEIRARVGRFYSKMFFPFGAIPLSPLFLSLTIATHAVLLCSTSRDHC